MKLYKVLYKTIRFPIMAEIDNIENEIEQCRKPSQDNKTVTYDLSGINFSDVKKTTKALAKVLFDNDIYNWISKNGKNLIATPTYKIEIIINNENKRRITKMEKDFKKYLGFDDIQSKYIDDIQNAVHSSTDPVSVLFFGIWAFVFQHFENKSADREYITNMMDTIMKNIEIL